jgi:hypothetical protein
MRPPQELLYESEASFRLVDSAIEELNDGDADVHHDAQPGGIPVLSDTLLRAYASLREELSELSNNLQFQDITSQQLVHIAALLGDMRVRLSEVAAVLGSTPDGTAKGPTMKPTVLQDPWTGVGEAQAVADESFAKRPPRQTA